MKNIKNYKAFLESYSEDVEKFILDDKEYALVRGGDIVHTSNNIEDVYQYLSDFLLKDKQITLDQKSEFDSIFSEKTIDGDIDQHDIDIALENLLDRFNIIEPFHIKEKSELEETPIDNSLDDMSEIEELTSILSEKIN